jgi:hypothetical protein
MKNEHKNMYRYKLISCEGTPDGVIPDKHVYEVSEDGKNLGVFTKSEAIKKFGKGNLETHDANFECDTCKDYKSKEQKI